MTIPYRLPLLSLAATALSLTGLAAGMSGSGGRIDRTYSEAFDRLQADPAYAETHASSSLAHNAGSSANQDEVGPPAGLNSAHIHLSRLPASGGTRPAFVVGDRMTVATREGGTRSFDVVEVRPLTGGETAAGSGALATSPSTRLFMVTAVATGDDIRTRKVRFIIDAAGSDDVLPVQDVPSRPHAL